MKVVGWEGLVFYWLGFGYFEVGGSWLLSDVFLL